MMAPLGALSQASTRRLAQIASAAAIALVAALVMVRSLAENPWRLGR
jgi:hypothetical protein